MSDIISVRCLINRTWSIESKVFEGDLVEGDLIEISTQTAEDGFGRTIPVGIVMLDDLNAGDLDGKFASIPVEFIEKL